MELQGLVVNLDLNADDFDTMIDRMLQIQLYFEKYSIYKTDEARGKKNAE